MLHYFPVLRCFLPRTPTYEEIPPSQWNWLQVAPALDAPPMEQVYIIQATARAYVDKHPNAIGYPEYRWHPCNRLPDGHDTCLDPYWASHLNAALPATQDGAVFNRYLPSHVIGLQPDRMGPVHAPPPLGCTAIPSPLNNVRTLSAWRVQFDDAHQQLRHAAAHYEYSHDSVTTSVERTTLAEARRYRAEQQATAAPGPRTAHNLDTAVEEANSIPRTKDARSALLQQSARNLNVARERVALLLLDPAAAPVPAPTLAPQPPPPTAAIFPAPASGSGLDADAAAGLPAHGVGSAPTAAIFPAPASGSGLDADAAASLPAHGARSAPTAALFSAPASGLGLDSDAAAGLPAHGVGSAPTAAIFPAPASSSG